MIFKLDPLTSGKNTERPRAAHVPGPPGASIDPQHAESPPQWTYYNQ